MSRTDGPSPAASRPARLALTPGEPAGIGPDLAVMLAARPRRSEIVAIADPELLSRRARLLGRNLRVRSFDPATDEVTREPGELSVIEVPLTVPETPGHLDAANAPYVLETLREAVRNCREGHLDGLVTGPVHKGIINEAGIPFTGHTEFLAGQTGTSQVVMMLATPGLRVALATTHVPLADVSRAITRPALEAVIRILHRDLVERFAVARPRILVCGLNPHAGEGGHLGREEIEVIGPVLEQLRLEGMELAGPLPADTLFTPRYLHGADAVLAMYHDQGLPVLKHVGFGRAVNVTLGLPIIRTSVDHGTAADLAGTGKASTGSLEYAVEVASDLARHRANGAAGAPPR